jgi:hypothetical protein
MMGCCQDQRPRPPGESDGFWRTEQAVVRTVPISWRTEGLCESKKDTHRQKGDRGWGKATLMTRGSV